MQVWLGIGSNDDAKNHLQRALSALDKILTNFRCSPVFESEAIGVKAPNFLNCVVTGTTSFSMVELVKKLKEIEINNGRARKNKLLSLDIDLLLYGNEKCSSEGIVVPHEGILKNAYVLLPLSLLSPFERHPTLGMTFMELWQQAELEQKIWIINSDDWLVINSCKRNR